SGTPPPGAADVPGGWLLARYALDGAPRGVWRLSEAGRPILRGDPRFVVLFMLAGLGGRVARWGKSLGAFVRGPPAGRGVFGAVTAFGILTITLNPAELDSALGMVLFVQMFLASTGFAVTARRGHFDPVLVHGSARPAVLFVQWCASVTPGAIAWAVVAGCGHA